MRTRLNTAIVFWLILSSTVSFALADEIRLKIPVEPVTVAVDTDGFARFSGKKVQYLSQSGEPAIPHQVVKMALPPNADPKSVTASIEDETIDAMPGEWKVRPKPPESTWDGQRTITRWPIGKRIVNDRDISVYESNDLFPSSLIGEIATGRMRRWRLVDIPLAAYQFSPASRRLYRLSEATLVVNYELETSMKAGASESSAFSDGIASDSARRLVVNYDQMAPEYDNRPSSLRAPQPASRYVIITTNSIRSASRQLDRFMAGKKRRGFEVETITEDMWGGGIGDKAAENIREWLKANYISRNIEYVLLIGNPHPDAGDVPMKMLWPRSYDSIYRESPSDYYFADLTGDWDLDGDGLYGESYEDFGVGGVDPNWEVLVGRIPYYGDIKELDRILSKIAFYENERREKAGWRKKALLAMEPSDTSTPGYQLGEAIKADVIGPNSEWGYHRIYEERYGLTPPPETYPCTVDNVTEAWNGSRFGAIFWWTHGWAQGASDIMDLAHAATLNDSFPGFTFQSSCHNSYPEVTNNLSYALLLNGAIATVGATRVSWYFPGQTYFAGSSCNAGMTYEYAKRLIDEELDSGRALHEMKQTLAPGIWMNFTVFNIYGDPSTGLFTFGDLGDLVEIVSVSTAEPYALSRAEKGVKAYIDRGYAITGLTPGLNGGVLVQTANDDKSLAAEDHLTLRFSKPALVYVCYDRRASTLPPWLQGWRPTAESISTTDSPASPMKVYWKSVTAGEEITLGGNHAGGDTGARSNYLVVIQPFPVEIVSVSSAEPYALSRAEKGVKAYIDRGYAITGLTPELNGGVLVQTANDDKSLAAEGHLTLRFSKPATVYVCYDKRAGTLPVWLQRWTPAGESISTTDISASPMKVYRKSVAADDEIILGGNHAGGDTGAKSNYLVVVQPFPVEILNVSTGEPYALTTAEKGAKPYIDRNYAITAIAPELSGGVLVQTANDDKSLAAEDHITLRLLKAATVYVCYDKRGTTMPPWLRSWTPAGESISTTDSPSSPMKVYRKSAAADDEVTLGGNHAGGDTGAKSNYLVVVAKP